MTHEEITAQVEAGLRSKLAYWTGIVRTAETIQGFYNALAEAAKARTALAELERMRQRALVGPWTFMVR